MPYKYRESRTGARTYTYSAPEENASLEEALIRARSGRQVREYKHV